MMAVFHCPRCNHPLGTPEDPKPTPLPPCPECGWSRNPGRSNALVLDLPVMALLMLAAGLAAGWVVGHSRLLVLLTLIALGPVAVLWIARTFSRGWPWFTGCYTTGMTLGMIRLNDGETMSQNGWRFAVGVGLGCLALGWLAGWLRHTD